MYKIDTTTKVALGNFAWYLAPQLDEAECLSHANTAGGVVLRGTKGAKAAFRLRQKGYRGQLWLDPAAYDRPSSSSLTLWDDWHQRELELEVAEFISPGSYVSGADGAALKSALRSQGNWVQKHGGRLSLALHYSWLTRDPSNLIKQLRGAGLPLALAFADRYDPLGRVGAVEGLIELLSAVNNVTLMRGDIGAVGAVAHGAALGAIGTSPTNRHVFPPDQKGVGPSTSPAVFVASLLSFKTGAALHALPTAACPTCELRCCNNLALGRFNTRTRDAEAIRHNRIAIRQVLDNLIAKKTAPHGAFIEMCQQALTNAQSLSIHADRPIDVSAQIRAWASI